MIAHKLRSFLYRAERVLFHRLKVVNLFQGTGVQILGIRSSE